jgi:hypothetical protein
LSNIFTRIFETIEKYDVLKTVWELVSDWLLPFFAPVAAIIAGYMQHESVMWIITAACLSFMGFSGGLLALMFVRQRNSPENKLTFLAVYQQDLDRPAAVTLGNRQQRRAQQPRLLGLQEGDYALRKHSAAPRRIFLIFRAGPHEQLGCLAEAPRQS